MGNNDRQYIDSPLFCRNIELDLAMVWENFIRYSILAESEANGDVNRTISENIQQCIWDFYNQYNISFLLLEVISKTLSRIKCNQSNLPYQITFTYYHAQLRRSSMMISLRLFDSKKLLRKTTSFQNVFAHRISLVQLNNAAEGPEGKYVMYKECDGHQIWLILNRSSASQVKQIHSLKLLESGKTVMTVMAIEPIFIS